MAVASIDGIGENQPDEVVSDDLLDFESWTRLISTVEHMYPENIDKLSLVYDSFLSEFPLCYGYWKKYAEHMSRLCSVEKVVQIFERAVESVPHTLSVWVDYCSFSISSFEDPSDVCRLFERGLSFVGKDYLCNVLWDKYIEFEYSQQDWNSLANIYIQTLKFPTKKLHQYYESFKKLVAIWEEEAGNEDISQQDGRSMHKWHGEIQVPEDAELCNVISDILDSSTRTNALQKYKYIGEQFYHRACEIDAKVQKFEKNIRRPYFHVKPLDDSQLQNWHQYLDQVEMEDDFDWVVKLYERCLVSCAHYPEFWMRYVDFVESKGGREIAADALNRATNIFLKNSPEIHLFSAWFKEKTGDVDGLRQAFIQCDQDMGSHFVDMVRRKANVEKRMGNYAGAASVYKKALERASEKRPDTLPMLYVHYARLQHMITYNMETTIGIFLDGINRTPHSKLLLKELISFTSLHDGAKHVDILESLMAQFLTYGSDVSGAIGPEDREEVSRLYLEFLDSCGSIDDIKKAWNRHLKFFPCSVRVKSPLKKFASAGAVLTMVGEGGAEGFNNLSHKSLMETDKKCMIQLPQAEVKASEAGENKEEYEQAMSEAPSEEGIRVTKGFELVASEVVNSPTKNEERADGLQSGTTHSADDQIFAEDVKNSGMNGFQKEREQMSKEEKPPNEESHCVIVSGSPGAEGLQKPSQFRSSSPTGGQDTERIPSTSSPLNPVDNEVCEDLESPSCTSNHRHKDSLKSISPDHLSDREGNQLQQKSYSRRHSEFGTTRNSRERPERSLSPRRRSLHGNSDSRYCRERSLSPRRNNSRWYPEERWQRERHYRRNTRYRDNLRGHRDDRMQNQHKVIIGSRNFQQQTTGSAPQIQLPVQSIMHPQTPINQFPQPNNEQYGNVQNSQLYNHMWQMYYHHQQQLLLRQQPGSQQQQLPVTQQQLQQVIPYHQLSQHNKNPEQQQQMPNHHNLQVTAPNQQLYQHPQPEQQHQINEESQSIQQLQLQQQMQLSLQNLYPALLLQQQKQQPTLQLQQPQVQEQQPHLQQQPHLERQQEAYVQQQQSYQHQQQQYLMYLQQLHQYQLSQHESGLVQDRKIFQKEVRLPDEQPEQENLKDSQLTSEKLEAPREDESLLADAISDRHQQKQGQEHAHASTSSGVTGQSQSEMELPEIEGTYVEICD